MGCGSRATTRRRVMWRKGAAQAPAEPARPDAEPGGAQKPACFSYPGERDVIRKIRRHVALSYGPHFFIGAATARLQARIALEELIGPLSRLPGGLRERKLRSALRIDALQCGRRAVVSTIPVRRTRAHRVTPRPCLARVVRGRP